MFNIINVIITIVGFIIAFFPDINIYVRIIILLGTAIIVILVKMYEVICEKTKKEEIMNEVSTENKKLKKELIEKERIQNIIDEKYREYDSNLLKEIKKTLNHFHTIEFIRTHDFAGLLHKILQIH